MGSRRYIVKLSNEDQLWHWHQNQLCYHHMKDDETQGAEINNSTVTSSITGDSPHVFLHHEESAEDAETTVSNSTPATGESPRGTRRDPLRDH